MSKPIFISFAVAILVSLAVLACISRLQHHNASVTSALPFQTQHDVNSCWCDMQHMWVSQYSYECRRTGNGVALNQNCIKGRWIGKDRCNQPRC